MEPKGFRTDSIVVILLIAVMAGGLWMVTSAITAKVDTISAETGEIRRMVDKIAMDVSSMKMKKPKMAGGDAEAEPEEAAEADKKEPMKKE